MNPIVRVEKNKIVGWRIRSFGLVGNNISEVSIYIDKHSISMVDNLKRYRSFWSCVKTFWKYVDEYYYNWRELIFTGGIKDNPANVLRHCKPEVEAFIKLKKLQNL